jgi:hypothetical protein
LSLSLSLFYLCSFLYYFFFLPSFLISFIYLFIFFRSLFLCLYTRLNYCRLLSTVHSAAVPHASSFTLSFGGGWNLLQLPAWWAQLLCPC